jgi:pimeloyl-ACP methyl ester carboxylesterase
VTFATNTGNGAVSSGENFTTLLPKYPKPAGTMPGILYLHGNTGDSFEALRPELSPVLSALVNAGYPILSGLWGGTSTWGNDTTLARITAGKTYLQGTMGAKAGKIVLIGASAGGCGAMVWASQNPTLVSCLVGLLPVSDLNDIYTNNRGSAAANLSSCYSGGWSQATYGAAHNPVTIAAAGGLSSIKMRLFNGASDATVIPSTVQTLATLAGANTVLTSVPGDHVWPTYAGIDAPTVLSFIQANA